MASIAKEKVLKANINEINKTFIENMFAGYHDKETGTFHDPPFVPTEVISLKKEEYEWVNGNISTTVGMLIFNRYILERTGIIQHLGYWNNPIDKKGLERLTAEVNNLAIQNIITIQQKGDYIDSRDRLGFWCAAFLAVAISPALIRPMLNVNQRKSELFKQYEKELNSSNPVTQTMTVNKIEKELMGMVRENLKNDPGYDLYRSGDGNLDNN